MGASVSGAEYEIRDGRIVNRQSGEAIPDDELTQALRATATKVDRMTTSQALGSLGGKPLVTRCPSAADAVTRRIQLTCRGREVAFKTVPCLAAAHEAFFPPFQGERRQIVSVLQQLIRGNDLEGL